MQMWSFLDGWSKLFHLQLTESQLKLVEVKRIYRRNILAHMTFWPINKCYSFRYCWIQVLTCHWRACIFHVSFYSPRNLESAFFSIPKLHHRNLQTYSSFVLWVPEEKSVFQQLQQKPQERVCPVCWPRPAARSVQCKPHGLSRITVWSGELPSNHMSSTL